VPPSLCLLIDSLLVHRSLTINCVTCIHCWVTLIALTRCGSTLLLCREDRSWWWRCGGQSGVASCHGDAQSSSNGALDVVRGWLHVFNLVGVAQKRDAFLNSWRSRGLCMGGCSCYEVTHMHVLKVLALPLISMQQLPRLLTKQGLRMAFLVVAKLVVRVKGLIWYSERSECEKKSSWRTLVRGECKWSLNGHWVCGCLEGAWLRRCRSLQFWNAETLGPLAMVLTKDTAVALEVGLAKDTAVALEVGLAKDIAAHWRSG